MEDWSFWISDRSRNGGPGLHAGSRGRSPGLHIGCGGVVLDLRLGLGVGVLDFPLGPGVRIIDSTLGPGVRVLNFTCIQDGGPGLWLGSRGGSPGCLAGGRTCRLCDLLSSQLKL